MKKIIILIGILFSLSVARSQKVYFVYLQSESQQPFYVRMGEKVYNATTSGYLVLSKLRDSTYAMNIGIEGSQTKEQLFSLTVNKKDQGYLLKNFGAEGWGLFNLQSFAVIKSASVSTSGIVPTEKKESNSFNELLAKAADDSTLMEKPANVKTEEKKEDPKPEKIDSVNNSMDEMKKTDSTVVKKEDAKSEKKEEEKEIKSIEPIIEKNEKVVLPITVVLSSKVVKHSESSTTDGFGLTFFDVLSDGTIDTIKILIPQTKKATTIPEIKKEDKKFLDIATEDTVQNKTEIENSEKANTQKSKSDTIGTATKKGNDCIANATEEDVLMLKTKMATEKGIENMINEAAKTFSTKCLTTLQIKDISSLFLIDEGKYKFFDAAYLHVSDISTFASLQSELKEEYFIRRFKAMLY